MHRQHCHRDRDHQGHRLVLGRQNLEHHRHPARRSLPDEARRLGDLGHRHHPDDLGHRPDDLDRLGDLDHRHRPDDLDHLGASPV
jgi:hypothetical protein